MRAKGFRDSAGKLLKFVISITRLFNSCGSLKAPYRLSDKALRSSVVICDVEAVLLSVFSNS